MVVRKDLNKPYITIYTKENGKITLPEDEWNKLSQEPSLHRIDGPAFENINGYKTWWMDGKRHRTDGPARMWKNGDKEWFISGIRVYEEEYNKLIQEVENMPLALRLIDPRKWVREFKSKEADNEI